MPACLQALHFNEQHSDIARLYPGAGQNPGGATAFR